jgi:hypothetical protein
MTSIEGKSELFLRFPERYAGVFVLDSDNVLTLLDPQPLVLCAAYLSSDLLDSEFSIAQAKLCASECELLFVPMLSLDGPPYRSGKIFAFQNCVSGAAWWDGKTTRVGAQMRRFAAATALGPWNWTRDERDGRSGYFLTGVSRDSTLWRVFRLETDALQHQVLTLAPMRVAPTCPHVDFSSVAEMGLRSELTALYHEFCQRVARNAYRDIPTKARNIVEGVVAYKLESQGRSAKKELGKDLETVKVLLDDNASRPTCGWSPLEYHLAHKIRLVHGKTHPGAVRALGGPIRPEFALSVVDDLGELLRIWGYIQVP